MKYRATLIVPGAGRETKPEQVFGDNLLGLEAWAAVKIEMAAPNAEIVIYEIVEKEIRRYTRVSSEQTVTEEVTK